ncbi:MAG: CHAT domain-containing protein, partial [Crocosphaera sp.]
IPEAIACYRNALTIRTPETDPYQCMDTGRNLGNLGFNDQQWDIAIEGYKTGIEAVETARSWAKTDQRRQEILRDGIQMYENIVQCYINIGDNNTALEYSDRSRSKTLSDFMASHDLYQGDIDPTVQENLQQYQTIERQLDNLLKELQTTPEKELVGATRKYIPPENSNSLQANIEHLTQEKKRLWEAIRRQDPVIAGLVTVPPPLTVKQMQRLIPNTQTAIVCFYSTDKDTHVFILRHSQTTHPPLQLFTCEGEGRETLQKWLLEDWFISYLKDFQLWRNNMDDILSQLSQRLQLDRLINEHLQDLEELIIIPHLSLHQIPFAALPIDGEIEESRRGQRPLTPTQNNPRSTRIFSDFQLVDKKPKTETKTQMPQKCLGDRFKLRIIPSLQILNYCYERETLNPSTLGIVENATEDLIFTPYECETIAQEFASVTIAQQYESQVSDLTKAQQYSDETPNITKAQQYSDETPDITIALEFSTPSPDITKAQQYSDETPDITIAQQLSVPKRLRGKEAIAEKYRQLTHEVNLLHSSHHASFNPNDPLNSLLLLADTHVRLGELINWRTPELTDVFLSCCETTVNTPKLTDDVL